MRLPIPSEARGPMRDWLAERVAPESQAFFVSRVGDRLTTRSVQRMIHATGASVGVHLTPHTLRHTFGRNLLTSGADVKVVQELMGHTSLETTAGHVRPRHEDRVAAVERIGVEL